MDKASDSVLTLKPVTFHYVADNANTPQFGLIAEEVAQVNQTWSCEIRKQTLTPCADDAVNAMLLNEFLKEHSRIRN